MVGAQATEQGDCSKFKGNIPHCCKKTPTVVDLLPGVPYNQQFTNCCKGGVVAAWGQDPTASVSAFQVSVGLAGTSNKTVKLPKNFTLLGPGPGYTCGPAKVVPSTIFFTPDHRRKTQALSEFHFPQVFLNILSFILLLTLNVMLNLCSCSDMECNMHLLAVSSLQKSKLLCFLLLFLQWDNHSLSFLCVWMPEQEQLYYVGLQMLIFSRFSFIIWGC